MRSIRKKNGFENVDFLLETIVNRKDSFNALLIIDTLGDELETVLMSRFRFPVEVITLKRYRSADGETLYEFEPFLKEIAADTDKIEISNIDTIVIRREKTGSKKSSSIPIAGMPSG